MRCDGSRDGNSEELSPGDGADEGGAAVGLSRGGHNVRKEGRVGKRWLGCDGCALRTMVALSGHDAVGRRWVFEDLDMGVRGEDGMVDGREGMPKWMGIYAKIRCVVIVMCLTSMTW